MFKHILCPIDGSACSSQALVIAARLAAAQSARLTICTVVEPPKTPGMAFGEPASNSPTMRALNDEARTLVRSAVERIAYIAPAEAKVLDATPLADAIADYAVETECDGIVMGSHGRTALRRVLLGSVAEGVLRRSKVPLMIVPQGASLYATSAPSAAASHA